jgi:hypothetical protein
VYNYANETELTGAEMYNFIVLGLVPGTDIQIGFVAWLVIGVLGIALLKLRHQINHLLIAHGSPRVGLHATQLHQRAV